MTEYGLLWFLWTRLLGPLPALAIALGYAATDEYHQTFVRGRSGTPVDWAIDAVARPIAVALWVGWRRRQARDARGSWRMPRGRDEPGLPRLRSMTTPKRTIATLLSAGMLLAAPGPVMAQGGAGDQQYQDPLGQVKPAKKKAHHKLVCKTRRQKHTRACKRLAAKRRAAARHHRGH